jgi:hypothetical protein
MMDGTTSAPDRDIVHLRQRQIHPGIVVLTGIAVLCLTWLVVGVAEASIVLWAELVMTLVGGLR